MTIHYGRIASGDEDVVDGDRRAAILDRTEAMVVAWEGAGGARACQFSGVPFVEIRGVTDSADGAAVRDFGINVKRALRSVAVVTIALARIGRDLSLTSDRGRHVPASPRVPGAEPS